MALQRVKRVWCYKELDYKLLSDDFSTAADLDPRWAWLTIAEAKANAQAKWAVRFKTEMEEETNVPPLVWKAAPDGTSSAEPRKNLVYRVFPIKIW